MTREEVIGYMESSFENSDGEGLSDLYKEMCRIAIADMEKQIPKEPINKELIKYSGGTQVLYANCPICEQPVSIYNGHQNNKEFRRDEDVFCNHCGQALDWSEEDE